MNESASMDAHDNPDASRSPRWPYIVAFLVFTLAVIVGLMFVYEYFDPFITNRPSIVAGQALIKKAREGPLSDAEFDQAIGLLTARETIAKLSALSVLELEASRSPERKAKIIVEFNKHTQSPDAAFAKSIGISLSRLKPTP